MLINLLQSYKSQNKIVSPARNCTPVNFKSLGTTIKPASVSVRDTFVSSKGALRKNLIEIRNSYIKRNPEAFLTLDHIKSNFDNSWIRGSIQNQTKELQAVSTKDFSNLSEIMKEVRLPEPITVYRAMEANDFGIGKLLPEEFFSEYYEEGKNVVIPIYMSTSFDKNVAFKFAECNPYRFIIKLDVPQNHPAVYMEELTPGDPYDKEDEVNVIRNSEIVLKNLQKIKNPLNNQEIYQIEGEVIGFKDVITEPEKDFVMDEEMLELFNVLKKKISSAKD